MKGVFIYFKKTTKRTQTPIARERIRRTINSCCMFAKKQGYDWPKSVVFIVGGSNGPYWGMYHGYNLSWLVESIRGTKVCGGRLIRLYEKGIATSALYHLPTLIFHEIAHLLGVEGNGYDNGNRKACEADAEAWAVGMTDECTQMNGRMTNE